MLTENGLEIDMERVRQVLEQADVLTIAFAMFPERLLIDARSTAEEGPLVALVEPVANVQERYLWLGRHRGAFGAPEAFSFFAWPHTVRNFIENDVLAPMRERLSAVSSEAEATLDDVLQQLAALEREAMKAAVRGDPPWRTIWERTAA